MQKLSTLREIVEFLHKRKKYWLGPIILMLVTLGALVIVGESTALGPFVYPFF